LFKKLSHYIGQYKKYVLLVPLVVFLDVLAELSMPLLMSKVVDVGIGNKDMSFILRTGGSMVGLAAIAMALGVTNMFVSTRASMGFAANLRNALFEKVQGFSFANIDKYSTASLITRLTNDVNNIQLTFMMALRILARGPMMLIVAFFLAYTINARLSLVIALAIPLLTIGVTIILILASKRFTIMQQKIDQINNTLQENLIAIRVVKAFVREDYEIAKFQRSSKGLMDAAIRAVTIVILNMPLMMLVMNGASLAVMWFGGKMVFGSTLGAGGLISFISYIFQILFSVMMISMVIVMGSRAEASARRVIEVLDTQIDIEDKAGLDKIRFLPHVTAGKIEFRNASFKYSLTGSGANVLENLNFTIQPGQVVGVVGGTGTGKSTLVNLIPRLYDITEGAVLVDNVDVRDYALETLRGGIGVVLQLNTLFSGTIRENLLWGDASATQEMIEAACRAAQAHDFITSFPNGYETYLGQGGVNLSGGQKQRLCIARAILKKPKILILDDATSAVDTATEARIRQAFYQELADTTVIIIAQRISSVRDADQIIILDDGKIAGIGAHAELMFSNPIYQEINASQLEGALQDG